jgi:hypothetical protein
MVSTKSERPRAANGRFLRQRNSDEKTEGVGQLALLSLAIVAAVVGFVFNIFWVGALVILGILWGSMAAERQRRSRTGKSVIAEVVDVVVEQAKDVAGSAQAKQVEPDAKA